MKKETLKILVWWLLPAVLVAASFLAGSHHGRVMASSEIEVQRDTITKIISVYKDFPEPAKTALTGYISVPSYKFITDTVLAVESREITVHDTTVVYLPRERKYYEENDGRLRLWVSGYEPRLDRWELDEQQTTITQTIAERRSRWSLGLTAGYGAALSDGTVRMSPYIGIGVSYALIQF